MDSLRVGSGCTPSAWQCPTHLKALIKGVQLEGLPARTLPLGCHGACVRNGWPSCSVDEVPSSLFRLALTQARSFLSEQTLRAQPLAEG